MDFSRNEGAVRFAVLGPLTVDAGDGAIPVSAGLPRTVLAVLLLAPNTTMSTDRLIDEVWPAKPPRAALESLRNHVARLRRQLGPLAAARVRTDAGGYRVDLRPGELDEHEFTASCAEGREALRRGDWAATATLLADALKLWRGRPFTDVTLSPEGWTHAEQLNETRLLALEGRFQADLHLGRHQDVVGELRSLTGLHPLREEFHAQLMLALYRSDRQAEAQTVYQRLWRTLRDELAVDPSERIRELNSRILAADPALAAPAPVPAAISAPGYGTVVASAPHDRRTLAHTRQAGRAQLPADTRAFVGREAELGRLFDLARQSADGAAEPSYGAAAVFAIDGMGGVGKTALAVRAAHRVRAGFPDGQLFLDLRGHSTGSGPLSTEDALGTLLSFLGLPPDAVPADVHARAALYRSLLDGTRTLIVLDDASSAAQVRPLLPAAEGCLVLVTSRERLVSLDDAHSLSLGVLPRPEARALLHEIAGPGRIRADEEADLDELAALCGFLPLTLRIAASRLRHRTTMRVRDLIDRLHDGRTRLAHLSDQERSLGAVFDSSFAALPPAERQLLRRLGLTPGPDFDGYAVAALCDSVRDAAERTLESLLDHNLLLEPSRGRYRLHDLLRIYASALSLAEPAEERDAAIARLFAYYRHAALAADRRLSLYPRPGPASADAVPPPTSVPSLSSRTEAAAWMRAERENLLAAFDLAAVHAKPHHALAISTSLAAFLQQEGPWDKAVAVHRAAVSVAAEAGRSAEALALTDFGRVQHMVGDLAVAAELYERSLAAYREVGDPLGEANALHDLGRARYQIGQQSVATELGRQALTIHQGLGEPLGEAHALLLMSRARFYSGERDAGSALAERSVAIFRELGHSQGEAEAVLALGHMRRESEDLPAAVELIRRALAIFQELGQRQGEANTLWALGRVTCATGDHAKAYDLIEQALVIYREFGRRQGEAASLSFLGYIRVLTEDFPDAATLFEESLPIYREIGQRGAEAVVLQQLGGVRTRLGDDAGARDLTHQALGTFTELGLRPKIAGCLYDLGLIERSTGDRSAAVDLLTRSLELYREVGDPEGEAAALDALAETKAD